MARTKDWNQKIIKEFREKQGRVGGNFENTPLLLLHTTCTKNGEPRIKPLAYLQDDERFVVIASKGAADTHPDWYYNLKAHPSVHVEVDTKSFDARAEITPEPESFQLYAHITVKNPNFAKYLAATERLIPVITLTRDA